MLRLLTLIIISINFLQSEDSYLFGWGSNRYGQLGIKNDTNYIPYTNHPIQIDTASNWVKFEWDYGSGIGLKEDGSIWSLGINYINKDKDLIYVIPQQVGNDYDWSKIYTTNNSFYAIKKNGTLWAWGKDSLLFRDKEYNFEVPNQVGNDSNWISLTFKDKVYFGIKSDGTVWYWGVEYNQLDHSYEPKQLTFLENVKDIGLINTFPSFLCINRDGNLVSYKRNYNNKDSFEIKLLDDKNDWFEFDRDYNMIKKRNSEYRIYKYDSFFNDITFYNYYKSLTHSYLINNDTIVERQKEADTNRLNLEEKLITLKFLENTAYFKIKEDSTLWCWGKNYYDELSTNGILGLGSYFNVKKAEKQILPGTKWKYLSTPLGYNNNNHMFAIKSDGTLWHWGLYIGYKTHQLTLINNKNNWKDIKTDGESTLALKSDGTIWSWGENTYGQLGLGDFKTRLEPTQLGTDNDWIKIEKYERTSLAMKKDGTLWMWGIENFSFGSSDLPEGYEQNLFSKFSKPFLIDSVSPLYDITFKNQRFTDFGSQTGIIILNNENLNTIVYKRKYYNLPSFSYDFNFTKEIYNEKIKFVNKANIGFEVFMVYDENNTYKLSYNFNKNIDEVVVKPENNVKIENVKQIVTSYTHYCLKNDGTVWAWGNVDYYQGIVKGIDFTKPILEPIQFDKSNDWNSIHLINWKLYGIKKDGSLWEFKNTNYNEEYRVERVDENNDYVNYFGNFAFRTLKNTDRYSLSGKIKSKSIYPIKVQVACNNDTVTTDENGYYIFNGLIKGNYKVNPVTKCNTYSPDYQEVEITQSIENIDFQYDKLYECFSISGIITNEEIPVYNLPISINDTIVYTDSLGRYFIEYLPENEYTITPIIDSLTAIPNNYTITLNENISDIDFYLIDTTKFKDKEDIIIDIYPNPIENNILNMNIYSKEKEIIEISLIDIFGRNKKKIQSLNIIEGSNELKINLNEYAEGIYFIHLKHNDKISLYKIIK